MATATGSSITIDPAKTALVIIDMQNFFLSPALGKSKDSKGAQAEKMLLETGLPSARKAGIRVVWLNWGLDEKALEEMTPTCDRGFGMEEVDEEGKKGPFGGGEVPKDCGLGEDLGTATLDGGEKVAVGRKLMRDQWNTEMTPPLMEEYERSQASEKPDIWLHKDRLSGFWHKDTMAAEWLRKEGVRTLLFGGVNTDQCVLSSLQDACHSGWDCVLLRDACGTTSPDAAREAAEWNCRKVWGFQTSCKELAKGMDTIASR